MVWTGGLPDEVEKAQRDIFRRQPHFSAHVDEN
jgi:hypothetical protein